MGKDKQKKQETSTQKQCDCEDLRQKIVELALTIDKVEDEKLVVENQLKKALADYQNLEASTEKRQQIRFFQMKKRLSEELIPSLDSMVLSIESEKTLALDPKEKAWFEGVVAIFESINKALEGIGLKIYLPQIGDIFDTSLHEAVGTSEGGKSGEISALVQPGYTLDGTVIRHARVLVSK